ncbi:MAG: hypothetical protein K2M36_03090, partial [Clostridia bacterium]|nr:hypothetical protein [Clostridia bacterium]
PYDRYRRYELQELHSRRNGYIKWYDASTDTEYFIIDTYYLPTDTLFPIGTFTWDYNDYSFDWQGGKGSDYSVVKVDYSYQWGYASTVKGTLNVPATNYKVKSISSINKPVNGGEDISITVSNASTDKDGYEARITINTPEINAETFDLVSYINGFTKVNGQYTRREGAAFEGRTVRWDLSELEKAIAARKDENGNVRYYDGIKATVTAYIGGDVFKVPERAEGSKYGFTGSGSTDTPYANAGYIAQAFPITIEVTSYKFEGLGANTQITFDPYSADVLNSSTLFGDGDDITIKVRNVDGTIGERTLSVGSDMVTIEAPFIEANGRYYDAYNNSIYMLDNKNINYKGYTGRTLYARITIGTEWTGQQTIYSPISIPSLESSMYTINVAHEDTFKPNWYEGETYQSYTIAFTNGARHTMQLDWATVVYYTNSACTARKTVQDIYTGVSNGTVYAVVDAYVMGEDGEPIGLTPDGKAQRISLRINVEQQKITSLGFFYDPTVGDIYKITDEAARAALMDKLTDPAYYGGTVYAQSNIVNRRPYGLDPINYAMNPDAYFGAGVWGDPFNGTAVLINLEKGTFNGKRYTYNAATDKYDEDPSGDYKYDSGTRRYVLLTAGEKGTSYIGYVHSWEYDADTKELKAEIGSQLIVVPLNIPDYAFTGIVELDGIAVDNLANSNRISIAGGKIAGVGDEALVLTYNVHNAWSLPANGTFTTKDEYRGNISTDIFWLDDSAPNPNTGDIKEDANGKYVERHYYFFDGYDTIRYPQEDAFVAKIYLEGSDDIVLSVALDGQKTTYDVFDEFAFATTATVNYAGGTATNVPVLWENTDMPSAAEIAAGKFERTYTVAYNQTTGHVGTSGYWTQRVVFTINNNFTIDGFTGNAKDGLAFNLTADKFYNGLPRTGVLNVGTKKINANLTWSGSYTTRGFSGNMTLTVSTAALTNTYTVAVNVERVTFVGLTAGTNFAYDVYGKENDKDYSLFANGSMNEIAYKGADGTEYTADVKTTYSFADIDSSLNTDADFYYNAGKFFGKEYKLNLTFSYNGGNNTMTEKQTVTVYF